MRADKIESAAWDCTIGAGEIDKQGPDADDLAYLELVLKHPPTAQELEEFDRQWQYHLMLAASP